MSIDLTNHGITVRDGFAFFWGGPLSNWFKSPFFIEDLLFHTSEHYMMYEKATLFQDTVAAKSILASKDPKKVKAIGRTVKNYNEELWSQHRFDVVYEGCLEKFLQNPELAKVLLATEGLELVEASPYDTVWGIGLLASDPNAIIKARWKGTNLLGLVLEKVRTVLVESRDS